MKVKFKKRGKDKIIMTLSHGLDIVVDRLEVSMIRDACNEFLEAQEECPKKKDKNLVVGMPLSQILSMTRREVNPKDTMEKFVRSTGEIVGMPKKKPKKLKFLCRECKDPCKLKVYGGDFIPFSCPLGHCGANWEYQQVHCL